ncbi:MAG: hypothetical protein ACRERV_08430, partial [Methylococcales bacterium]
MNKTENAVGIADAELGDDNGAIFVMETGEIVRLLPSIRIPMEALLYTIGNNVVIDAMRRSNRINRYEAVSLDDSVKTGEGGNLEISEIIADPNADQTKNMKGVFFPNRPEMALNQLLDLWRNHAPAIELSDEQQIEEEQLLRLVWQTLHDSEKKRDSGIVTDRMSAIKLSVLAPLRESQRKFEQWLREWPDAKELSDRQHKKQTKDIENLRKELKDELERFQLNWQVIETTREGYLGDGYSEERIAEKLGLKNRDAVRERKSDIACLLAPICTERLRAKLIQRQLDYIEGIKEEAANAMPGLPKTLSSYKWIPLLQWLSRMLHRTILDENAKKSLLNNKLDMLFDRL